VLLGWWIVEPDIRPPAPKGLRNPICPGGRTFIVMSVPGRHDRLADDALLTAVALGERDAFAVFVRRFQRRVFGLAFTIVGDGGLAEDVAQQAFERVWRHASTYEAHRASVSTWLLTITRNLAIDATRVRRPIPLDPWVAAELLAPDMHDPASRAVDSDDLRRLRVALDALPAEQRRAVLLATIGGRTSVEIGLIEDVPVGTAKTRLRTGLRRLRAAVPSEVAP
jgi:RNA polymerase sigma factor (sigma-70 family)